MFDPLYYIIMIPAIALSALCSLMVKSTFAKYSRVAATAGLTGAQAAATMLSRSGVMDVKIQRIDGFLSDNYNPATKVLSLSPDVYDGRSLSALGVACHEAGHALQHADSYVFLNMRSALVPAAAFGSKFCYIVIFVGCLLSSMALVKAGIILFSLSVLFALVTLPVEWNASARAKDRLVQCGMLRSSEIGGAAAVLNAAFMTYVAAAFSSILTLLYYLYRAGLLGNSGRRR